MKQEDLQDFDSFYEGYDQPIVTKSERGIHSKRSYIVVGLVFSCIIFADLFFWQMNHSLNNPFTEMIEKTALLFPRQTKQSAEDVSLALQKQDTDSDGLSDYDELYTYSTSAYITDTDSDGISDSEEVRIGEDPNCAKDKNCDYLPPDPELATLDPTSEYTKDSADSLRIALEKAGLPKEQIAMFSDEELVKLYQDVISRSDFGASASEGDDATTQQADPKDLLYFEQLSAPEIRELLIGAGIDENLIKTIPDEKIKDLYLETLGKVSGSDTTQATNTTQ